MQQRNGIFREKLEQKSESKKKDSFTHSTGKRRNIVEESTIIRRMLDDSPNSVNIITLFVWI